ncbi:hypothetical protein AAT18_21030 [Rhodococcus aetherivorans]|nr:hypothetical protein AAT18_21030 [Rhodococcus aetherivorans]
MRRRRSAAPRSTRRRPTFRWPAGLPSTNCGSCSRRTCTTHPRAVSSEVETVRSSCRQPPLPSEPSISACWVWRFR